MYLFLYFKTSDFSLLCFTMENWHFLSTQQKPFCWKLLNKILCFSVKPLIKCLTCYLNKYTIKSQFGAHVNNLIVNLVNLSSDCGINFNTSKLTKQWKFTCRITLHRFEKNKTNKNIFYSLLTCNGLNIHADICKLK